MGSWGMSISRTAVYRTGADGLPQQIETDVEPKTSKPSILSMLDHGQISATGSVMLS